MKKYEQRKVKYDGTKIVLTKKEKNKKYYHDNKDYFVDYWDKNKLRINKMRRDFYKNFWVPFVKLKKELQCKQNVLTVEKR